MRIMRLAGATGCPSLPVGVTPHLPSSVGEHGLRAAASVVSTHQHVPVLDTWRGIAVTLLLLGHFRPIAIIDQGALGVECFFVLSGFLMGRILFVKQTPLKRFYQHRISRIFPAAYLYLFCIVAYIAYATSGAEPGLSAMASTSLFCMNYLTATPPTEELGRFAGHYWSLCVEEHTYILLSGLALLHRRKGVSPLLSIGLAILACFGMSLVVGNWYDWDPYKVYWRSDCRGASILCGSLAACLIELGTGRQTSYFRVPSIAWGVVAVTVGVAFRLTIMPEFIKHTAGTMALAWGLLLVAQHAKSSIWAFPPFVWLGTISFSLYLWQQPFFIAVKQGQLSIAPAIIGSLICGTLCYIAIERPARAWINQRWR